MNETTSLSSQPAASAENRSSVGSTPPPLLPPASSTLERDGKRKFSPTLSGGTGIFHGTSTLDGDMPSRRGLEREESGKVRGKKECLPHGRQNNPSHFSANFFSLSLSFHSLSPPELPHTVIPLIPPVERRLNFNVTNEILMMSLLNNTVDK